MSVKHVLEILDPMIDLAIERNCLGDQVTWATFITLIQTPQGQPQAQVLAQIWMPGPLLGSTLSAMFPFDISSVIRGGANQEDMDDIIHQALENLREQRSQVMRESLGQANAKNNGSGPPA